MKEPLPVPTLPYGYGGSPQASMGMYQVPGIHNAAVPTSKNYEIILNAAIDGFHSRDLQSCGTQMTKATTTMLVHITKAVH